MHETNINVTNMEFIRLSWEKSFDTGTKVAEENILIQTDGGLREDDCAAAAYIIGLVNQGSYQPLPLPFRP